MQNISPFIEEFLAELNRQSLVCDSERARKMRKLDSKMMFTAITFMIAQRDSNFKSLSTLLQLGDLNLKTQFAASSFCEARKNFSPYFFVDLCQWIYKFVQKKLKKSMWFCRDPRLTNHLCCKSFHPLGWS